MTLGIKSKIDQNAGLLARVTWPGEGDFCRHQLFQQPHCPLFQVPLSSWLWGGPDSICTPPTYLRFVSGSKVLRAHHAVISSVPLNRTWGPKHKPSHFTEEETVPEKWPSQGHGWEIGVHVSSSRGRRRESGREWEVRTQEGGNLGQTSQKELETRQHLHPLIRSLYFINQTIFIIRMFSVLIFSHSRK